MVALTFSIDSWAGDRHRCRINYPPSNGRVFRRGHFFVPSREDLARGLPARTSVNDVTIARLVGIGPQDVAAAMVVLQKPGLLPA